MKKWMDDALIFRDFEREFPVIERGEGIYLYDESGKRYIDGAAGSAAVTNIGHGVEEVAHAVELQIRKYAYCPSHFFANRPSKEIAELLATIAPHGLNKVWLVVDGSEATEAAVKLARQFQVLAGHPSKSLIISRWQSYHGATLGALGYGGFSARRSIFSPLLKQWPHIPPAYCYRCYFGKTYPDCGIACAWSLEKAIRQHSPENVAAFIAEPVVGAALGAVPPPNEYFPIIRKICDTYGVLFIADEVMTGFGRTGEWFGINNWNVKPDMITCAKGISGGYVPLGAVIAHEKLLKQMETSKSNVVTGHTFCAHHVTSAAAVAAVQYILDHNLIEKAKENGAYFLDQLTKLKIHPIVGDVRGLGLFAGIEFVEDKATTAPLAPGEHMAARIGGEALQRGLITYPGTGSFDGVMGDHILLAPPLIINRPEIDEMVSIIKASIDRIEKNIR